MRIKEAYQYIIQLSHSTYYGLFTWRVLFGDFPITLSVINLIIKEKYSSRSVPCSVTKDSVQTSCPNWTEYVASLKENWYLLIVKSEDWTWILPFQYQFRKNSKHCLAMVLFTAIYRGSVHVINGTLKFTAYFFRNKGTQKT